MSAQNPSGKVSYQAAINALLTEDLPVDHNELEAKVTGELPKWLDGALYKNGPGTYKNLMHLFDGYSCIAKTRFADGRAYVSNKQLKSQAWQQYAASGQQPQLAEFLTSVSILQSLKGFLLGLLGLGPGFTDNATVNILPVPGDVHRGIAMTEDIPGTYEVNLENLETVRQVKYSDKLPGILTTAHPSVMPDGSIVNFTSAPGGRYTVYRQKPGAPVREKLAEVPMRARVPCWIHDFKCSENYMLLPETPCYFNLKALALGTRAEFAVMDWYGDQSALVHVIPLDGKGPVRTFRAPNYFTFHYMNVYEEGSKLHMDFSHHKDPEMLNTLYLDVMRKGERAITKGPLRRLTIDLDKPDQEATITDLMRDNSSYHQCEFPSVNPDYMGKPYRYGYSAGSVPPHTYSNAVVKYDVQQGETKVWHEAGAIALEPVMVPRQTEDGTAVAEDDGVVLTMVTDANAKCFVLVQDASSFEELARVWLPYNLAYSFHGRFAPSAKR